MKQDRFLFGKKVMALSILGVFIWMATVIAIYRSSFASTTNSNFKEIIVEDTLTNTEISACSATNKKLSPDFWRKVKLSEKDVPSSINDTASKVLVLSSTVTIQRSEVHYLYARPKVKKNISILLLHGQSYSSETWNTLGTIQNIAAFGYYVVAIDLPGFGKSEPNSKLDRVAFLRSAIVLLELKDPVIVSPSMSGAFSLQLLIEYPSTFAAFVPVSPVGIGVLQMSSCSSKKDDTPMDEVCQQLQIDNKKMPPHLQCIPVPTMIVFGENDEKFRQSSTMLCHLPNSQAVEIPNGRHSAYLSNPELWHKLLFNFLNIVSDTIKCR